MEKIAFWILWIGTIAYAFLLAPPDQPDTFDLIKDLSTGNIEGINPLIVALFNILGIWPGLYAALLFADGRMQKIKAWPFVLGSLMVGAFSLLPYLGLRKPNPSFTGDKNFVLRVFDSRWYGLGLCLGTIALLVYGLREGNWADFAQQWQTSRFIHVMSLDFCLLCLLFPTLLGDDMARRGLKAPGVFWAVALLPLLGPALYVVLRPSLQVTEAGSETTPTPETARLKP